MSAFKLPGFAAAPTRFLFFTGKGGVGKTSLSTATAIALADSGQRVLLVSTDAASNQDEMLGVPLSNQAVPVPGVPGLQLLHIDPDTAAEAYRQRVLAQLDAGANEEERQTVREQLSGARTTEIAAFDEFAALQDDLRRAKIEPWAWVINKSLAAAGTNDPLLQARLEGEVRQAQRIAGGLAKRTFVLPWLVEAPVGADALGALVTA